MPPVPATSSGFSGFYGGCGVGFGGGGPSAHARQSTLAGLVDFSQPAQSLRGITRAQIDAQAASALAALGAGAEGDGLAATADYCFLSMVQREQALARDFVCFYHSYNHSALLYEVQAEVARTLWPDSCGDDFAPLCRLLKVRGGTNWEVG
jgi:hypothetical protein